MATNIDASNQNQSSSSICNFAIDDGFSPFFIHHADNPGFNFDSQSLIGDNYASWNRVVMIVLL